MDKPDFTGARVLVCGLMRSGMAAARLLINGGAEICVSDVKPFEKMDEVQRAFLTEVKKLGAELFLGNNPDDILTRFNYIVISPGIPIDAPFIEKAQDLGIPVIGELELGSMVCGAPIIAFTGTNGKTSASTITGDIMKIHAPGSETLGNIGDAFCEKAASISREAWVTLEVSSFQLESIRSFHPKIAAVLNIREDHLNRHYTLENYVSVKERIFENQGPGDTLILNYDDPYCRDMSLKTQGDTAWFSSSGRIGGKGHTVYLDGDAVWYEYKSYVAKLWEHREMRVPFLHILEDSMAAALAAIIAGAPVKLAAQVVKSFEGVPHRVEYVGRIDGADYYNDSKATNVDSAVKALEAAKGRVILIGGGQDKKADFMPWVKLFDNKAAYVLLFGETASKIADICEKVGFSRFRKVKGLKEAVDAARELAGNGDSVLLSPACASLDMFKDFEERGKLFKEYVLKQRS